MKLFIPIDIPFLLFYIKEDINVKNYSSKTTGI